MNNSEAILQWLLRIIGAISLTAFFCVFLPYSWMNTIHDQWLGMGTLPSEPIVGYLARSLSAMYAFLGGILCLVSGDVRRYLLLIRFIGLAMIGLGVLLTGIDFVEGLPIAWTLGEGPWVVVYGVLVVWLAGRVQDTATELRQ